MTTTGAGRRAAPRTRTEDEAFAALVRRHDEALRRLAWHLVRDRDAMDDVLQEVYVRAYRALGRFRGESALRTWLHRITYNACMDELRRRRARPQEPLADVERDPRPGPAEAAEARGALAAALAALPPEERAAVLMVDAAGFAYGEAAQALGVPEGTVASRLSRARRALRRALDGEETA